MIETLRFKIDTPLRRRLYVPESMAHPAKGHLAMWQEMVLRYSEEGDTILDPMAGIGTTLVAALMGRNVICVELEHHFNLPMVRSWAKMRQNPMLGFPIGAVQVLWGDARDLARCRPWPYQDLAIRYPKAADLTTLKAIRRKYRLPLATGRLPLADASVGAAITSPPYEGSLVQAQNGIDEARLQQPYGPNSQFARPQSYTRSVDAIVTSPPYEEGLGHQGSVQREILTSKHIHGGPRNYTELTRPVDAIVTSPPFQDPTTRHKADNEDRRKRMETGLLPRVGDGKKDWRYDDSTINIGNLRSAAYWEAMRQVYAECWRVLKPGGLMALVLKGFTRDGQYVDLPGQTEALLLEAGWQKHDHWRRELWALSFWRTLQARKGGLDERLWYETVLAFRKPVLRLRGR